MIEMTDTTERLAEIEARVEAATEGPWEATPTSDWDGVPQCAVVNDTGRITWDDHGGEVFHPHDAEFIARARTDVPWLVEQVRELQAENKRLQQRAAFHQMRSLEDAAEAGAARERVRELQAYIDRMPYPSDMDQLRTERDAAREQVRQQDEVIARVRALVEVLGPLRAEQDGDGDE